MTEQTSLGGVVETYLKYQPVVEGWTFIVATEDEDNIDLYSGMEGISGVHERLFTPFARGRISIVNGRILERYDWLGDDKVRFQKCISFDTQTVSYVEQYYKKGTVPYAGFNEVLQFLKGRGFAIDCFPYTMENLLIGDIPKESAEQTLFAYEMLCSENAGKPRKCRRRARAIVSMYEKKRFDMPFRIRTLYQKVYLALLKMSQIQLGDSKLSVGKKMSHFMEFLDNELGEIMLPEINLAKRYFAKGNSLGFFGKIHTGNDKILPQLKNMAWDLLHLRFMDYSCTMFDGRKCDAIIPYFFTYDKRLQEIRSCYTLRVLAFNSQNHAVIPVYALEDGILEETKEYHTFAKHRERAQRAANVDALIRQYEELLIQLI